MFRGDDARMHPPTVVTTMGQIKQQYAEPDWYPAPQKQKQPRPQVEGRDNYWAGNAQRNSLVGDERDARMPTNNFQYSMAAGRALQLSPPGSPRQYQYQPQPPPLSPRTHQPQQQQMSSRELASYWAAIKAVDDSMNADGQGSFTAMRGLWKVFDAAVSELGTELSDSLSNKAIFEANTMQETLFRQGRKISEMEKKSDALSRRGQYESTLKSTMLRLRGSFADVILGTRKELQQTIDTSFATKMAEIEQLHGKQLADKEKSFAKRSTEIEKSYLKKSIGTEQSFSLSLAEKEQSWAMKIAEIENDRNSAHTEIERLRNELNELNQITVESSQTTNMLHTHLSQERQKVQELSSTLESSEQSVKMVQTQLAQERASFSQAIANVEKSRDDTVKKLSSTLETLQNMCSSSHSLEMKLAEANEKNQRTQERVQLTEERNEAATQQWNMENERANILHNKLDAEIKNKNALINVQREMERHLSLERERGDLLQHELDTETGSKQEIVASLQEADSLRRKEIDRVSQENTHMLEQVESLQESEKQLLGKLDHISQENMNLQELMRSLHGAERQRREDLDRASQENVYLRGQLNEANDAGASLKVDLDRTRATLEEQVGALHKSRSEHTHLSNEFRICNDRLEKTSEMSLLLEVKVGRLEAKVQDQAMDLEAARMSEAEVERSLAESLGKVENLEEELRQQRTDRQQRVDALDTRLKQTITEMHTIAEKLNDECNQKRQTVAALEESEIELARLRDEKVRLESERDEVKDKLGITEDDLINLQKLNVQKVAALEEAENELARLRDMKIRLESEREELQNRLGSAEDDFNKIRKLNNGLESETGILQDKLRKVETDYSQDRDKIANALAGFEEEMTNAERKLRSVLEELEKEKEKVKHLTEAQMNAESELTVEAQTLKLKFDEEMNTLKLKMDEQRKTFEEKMNDEKKRTEDTRTSMEQEMTHVKDACCSQVSKYQDECNNQVLKYQQDIGVYEEAIKMLQKQVDILQEMADAKCEDKSEQSRSAELVEAAKEEARQEFLARINAQEIAIANKDADVAALQEKCLTWNAQKLEHESDMLDKNADIISLREKCQSREESMKKLENLCVKAREDLLQLRDQKKFLEESLDRSIQYIQESKQSQATDAIELVATIPGSPKNNGDGLGMGVRFHNDAMTDLDDICATVVNSTVASIIKSTPHIDISGLPRSCKDIGTDLDALLTCIEAQLGVEHT